MDENKISRQTTRPHPRVETLGMRAPVAHGDVKPFGPDNPPPRSPGRPKGSRNKIGSDLKELILQAAEETGFVRKDPETGEPIGSGDEGIKGYLKWAALYKADRFLGMISHITPPHVSTDFTQPTTKETLTYEETVAQLRERGLPPELINHLRKAPPGANDLWPGENPDPYGMKNVTPKSDT
jgi:hypothetical protein